MNDWISVKERLPDDDQFHPVIVEGCRDWATYKPKKKEWWISKH